MDQTLSIKAKDQCNTNCENDWSKNLPEIMYTFFVISSQNFWDGMQKIMSNSTHKIQLTCHQNSKKLC
jgi:hypothetical protein